MIILKNFLILLTIALIVIGVVKSDDNSTGNAFAILLFLLYLIYLVLS